MGATHIGAAWSPRAEQKVCVRRRRSLHLVLERVVGGRACEGHRRLSDTIPAFAKEQRRFIEVVRLAPELNVRDRRLSSLGERLLVEPARLRRATVPRPEAPRNDRTQWLGPALGSTAVPALSEVSPGPEVSA